MSGDYSESVALFSKPQSTYTGETGGEADPATDTKLQNGSIHEPSSNSVQQDGQIPAEDRRGGKVQGHGKGQAKAQPEWLPPEDEGPSFDEMMSSIHEKAMSVVGFGRIQWMMLVVLGLGVMGDNIELVLMAYILPSAERELCMTEQMKGWLGAVAFAGMMVGGTLWGNMSDKLGRPNTLISALITNGVFSALGAFMPTYWLFLVCRFMSGLGIGGSIPIVFTYFAEFCPLHGRGQKITLLMFFWGFGGIYVSGLGWLIIPHKELVFPITHTYAFGSWRIFMLICSIPIFISTIALFFMPESPRYLLQKGKDLEALTVYRKIYSWNHTEAGAEYEMPEIELPSRPGFRRKEENGSSHRFLEDVIHGLENFWNSIFQLFFPPLTSTTILLACCWFSVAFGYFGLIIWFPEYMTKIKDDLQFSQRTLIKNETIRRETFEGYLTNVYYYNSTFVGVAFRDIYMQQVTFDMCFFRNCVFENVTATKSYFVESIVNFSNFNNTNFYPSRFQGTIFKNSSMMNMKEGCRVDFHLEYNQSQVFLENFLSQLAVIPGMVIGAVAIDRIGRIRLLALSLTLSALSIFFIWVIETEVGIVIMNAIFNFLMIGAWNSVDVLTAESYPTQLRSTGFGFLASLARIAAIIGNVTFGSFINISKSIPILITAGVLGIGALCSLKLTESKNKLL